MTEQLRTTVLHETSPGRTYLVTEDLSKIIQEWCRKIGKPYCDDQFIRGLMEPLRSALQDCCFPDGKVKVVALPRESFADILDRNNSHDAMRQNEFWVSLDSVYTNVGELGKDGFIISVTRFVDKDNLHIGRGPRPETSHHSIDQQIMDCHRSWERSSSHQLRPIILVDDGTFSGDTVVEILGKFAKMKMYVESVRLGVANPEAIRKIALWEDDATKHRIIFVGCLKLCPPVIDWVCQRDFFPEVPLSGRAVGVYTDTGMTLIRANPSGKPVRKPYLFLWGDIKEWASVEKGVAEFTKETLILSIKLWEELEKWWEQKILVSDLECIYWYAYRSKPNEMSAYLNKRWIDILQMALDSIPG